MIRKSIQKSVLSTVRGLHKINLVDDITLREMESMCLPKVKNYSPSAITTLRKKLRVSQAAFARLLNISLSTIQKWEVGAKKPSGASSKLLFIAERKGISGLV